MTPPPPPTSPTRGPDPLLLAAGVLQIACAFTPAARVRLLGTMPFARLPSAGVALLVLGAATLLVAYRPARRRRARPGVCSALVRAVAYWRLAFAPSGTFVDPVLRRAVRPAWGFAPMAAVVALGILRGLRQAPRDA